MNEIQSIFEYFSYIYLRTKYCALSLINLSSYNISNIVFVLLYEIKHFISLIEDIKSHHIQKISLSQQKQLDRCDERVTDFGN